MKWAECSLDELGYVSRGKSKHRPRNDPMLFDGQYPFVQTADVKHAQLYITDHSQTYNDRGLEQSRLWPKDTLCITIAANIADTALLGYEACFPDSIIGFIADPEKCDVHFIKYYFDVMQTHYKQISQGAAQDNLSQRKLLSLKIPAPSLPIQHKIAEILSAYDDLIANNERRIALLEEAMHLLYREWFVHLRFPGWEETAVVDGVPEGWESKHLADVIEINPKTQYKRDEIRPFVPMGSLATNSMVISPIEERTAKGGAKFKNEDTLLARITPCLENGKTAYVQFMDDMEEVATGSTEFIVLRSKAVTPRWVYCLARSYNFRQTAINSMAGSDGRQRVKPNSIAEFEILNPPKQVLKKFDDIAAPTFHQIHILTQQNQKLREARDALLPRLMSGRIEV